MPGFALAIDFSPQGTESKKDHRTIFFAPSSVRFVVQSSFNFIEHIVVHIV